MKFLVFTLTFLSSFSAHAADALYKISHRIPLSGPEGWDLLAVDPQSDRLFVTRSNRVDVIDLKKDAVIGTITKGLDGAHGVAFVPNLKKGYITSGRTGKVVVFNLDTLQVQSEITAGDKPDVVLFDANSGKLFVFNSSGKSVTVINPENDAVVKTIPVSGEPEFGAVIGNNLYFNTEDNNSLGMIDTHELVLKKTWPLPGCDGPTGMAADIKAERIFSACGNGVMVVSEAKTGKNIKNIPIGKGPDGSGFDDGYIFSSNGGSGDLSVIKVRDPNSFDVTQTLSTQKGARTMAINSVKHTIYTIAAKYAAADPKAPHTRPAILPGSVEILVLNR
ncbi:MAG: YncE family protein [Chitinophagaceae bacterium]|nr:YncE family protein [Oligoflexus sp.]